MKKLILATFFILSGCAQPTFFNIFANSESTRPTNPSCLDLHKLKVMRVLENKQALARECLPDHPKTLCIGTTVSLAQQPNIEYYDEMVIVVPEDKCLVQHGVYRYEIKLREKEKGTKTVPIVYFENKYQAE